MEKEKLEKLEKEFILNADAEIKNIEHLIKTISKFAVVDKEGHVIIKDEIKHRLTISDKVLLLLATRFLANKLQEKLERDITISPIVNTDEISDFLKIRKNVAAARLNELKIDKKILSKERGNFTIAPYYIETTLEKLEKIREKS